MTATYGYSADRLQLTSIVDVKGTTNLLNLTYNYGTSPNNDGQISKITDNVDNRRTVSYTYDNLARLSSAQSVGDASYPQWGLSFGYDRYGNRTSQAVTAGTGPSNSVAVSATTNRITTVDLVLGKTVLASGIPR